jgi:hypothetical protein
MEKIFPNFVHYFQGFELHEEIKITTTIFVALMKQRRQL